jgi:cytochrome c peroxidase
MGFCSLERLRRHIRSVTALVGLACLGLLAVEGLPTAHAAGGGDEAIGAISTADVPQVPGIDRFIRDSGVATRLGKALFWDMQAGSDGRQACASCHFNAGADNRNRNQINPHGGAFSAKGANALLTASDFPMTNGDVVGSQGVLPSKFNGVTDADSVDDQSFGAADKLFNVNGVDVRRSTGRNTPSAVNAVFNFRNFWDGRAQNEFNGVNPFGTRDPDARIGQVNGSGGVDKVAVSLTNSSLASQADGPPGNPVEMSADGRTLSDIGKKLLTLQPLGEQSVAASDNVLGDLAHPSGRGLNTSYAQMIRQAFASDLWDSGAKVSGPDGKTYTLMQYNFPLFWGLAIQQYEATLVSDQSPFDQFMRGDSSALSSSAQTGMGVFAGKGQCQTCHSGTLLSSASAEQVDKRGLTENGHDTGFENIGVRPDADDGGQAGTDPFGKPLSISGLTGGNAANVAGTFKVPGLRNVELTAPYFHNGSELTLRQVVDFYSRGGDFANPGKSPNVRDLGLSDGEKDDLVSFLTSLTDERVRNQAAPFDHPQLFVANGEQARADGSIITDAAGRAVDCFTHVPATGRSGGAALAKFPGLGGACAAAPPLPRPLAAVPGGVSSRPIPSTNPASGSRRPSPSVLRLSINRRLSVRDVRRHGIRLRFTVPQTARKVRLRIYRISGKRQVKVADYVKKIKKGGRISLTYKSRITKRLKTGSYRLQVDAGPARGAYLPGGAAITVKVVKPVRR